MRRPISQGTRVLLAFGASTAFGLILSFAGCGSHYATDDGSNESAELRAFRWHRHRQMADGGAPVATTAPSSGATGGSTPATAATSCGQGVACAGTTGCAGACDSQLLITACARCENGAFAGCSQGECSTVLNLAAPVEGERACPDRLLSSCTTVTEQCVIGGTSHQCQCSPVGGEGQLPIWICQ
jgi:hypothetical protein